MPELRKLTSLRFFFALWVFLSHCDFILGSENFLYKYIFSYGYVAVGFFFILSGFILSYVYKEKIIVGDVKPKRFILLRLFRLYPLYLLTLILAIPLGAQRFSSTAIPLEGTFLVHAFMLQSFIPDKSIFFAFNGPAWSVSNEMFFYLLFPAIILYPRKFAIIYAIVLTVLMVVYILFGFDGLPLESHYMFYINPLVRLMDFIYGVWLFKLYETKKELPRYSIAIGLVIFAVFFPLASTVPQAFIYSIYFYIPIGLIIVCCARDHNSTWFENLIDNQVLIYLGKVSYGIYLYHILVLSYVDYVARRASIQINPYLYLALNLLLVILVAVFSYEVFERRINGLLRKRFIM